MDASPTPIPPATATSYLDRPAGRIAYGIEGVAPHVALVPGPRRPGLRTIGLLGGMSWESSAEYYRLANEMVRARLGGLHSAHLILSSLDFADIERLQTAGRWNQAGDLLADAARGLEAAGAGLVLLCTNTMHKVADQIDAAIAVPLLHIADTAGAAIAAAGLTTVGLLGTAFTMEQDFYRDRLATHGLRVITSEADQRAELHRIIYQELCLGIINDCSRRVYCDVIAGLVDGGAEGVILGCTEIELLVTDNDTDVRLFPTTRLHVSAAVDWAMTNRYDPK